LAAAHRPCDDGLRTFAEGERLAGGGNGGAITRGLVKDGLIRTGSRVRVATLPCPATSARCQSVVRQKPRKAENHKERADDDNSHPC